MSILHPRCAGIDIHKKSVTVCLVTRDAAGDRQSQVRKYGTMTGDLLKLAEWLRTKDCPVAGMESTGVYWKPVLNILQEEGITVTLVNPADIKRMPGRKTDIGDSEWIAELMEEGKLKPSFIPPVEIRELREVVRYRRKLVQMAVDQANRLHKEMEDAHLKLGDVASDILGKSGRAILKGIIAGESNPKELAELAVGRLRSKKEALAAALDGRIRPHHRYMLGQILEMLEFIEVKIAECERRMEELCAPFLHSVELMTTIPGVKRISAQEIIAEIGVDMSQFPSAKHLCAWAGLAPGNNQTAGKRRRAPVVRGNRHLRTTLVQCAHAASHTKQTYLAAQFWHFCKKRGPQHAAIVVAHTILEDCWYMLAKDCVYHDLGPDHYAHLDRARLINTLVHKLEGLGMTVHLQESPLQPTAA